MRDNVRKALSIDPHPQGAIDSENSLENTMQEMESMKNAVESHRATRVEGHDDGGPAQAAPIKVDTEKRLGRGPAIMVGLLAVVLAILIGIGIRQRALGEKVLAHETAGAAIESVSVVTPKTGADAQEIVLPAKTQAYIDTPIYSRTNGYLQHWYADIGANVHKGELLAIIQTPEVDQQVNQAKADVATAQANQQIAEITANRWKKLMAQDAVSKQETDQAMSDLSARQSTLNSAIANLYRVQQLQGFERIEAPFNGVITARDVDEGALIQAGDINSQRGELFHLACIDRLRVYVPVPEVYVGSVRDGERVNVTSDAFPNETFTGTVVRNSKAIDMASRTLNVEVDVENANHHLLPGQYTFVHLPLPAGTSSMTLPSNTLLFRAEGLRVGVVRGSQVHLAPIRIGHDYGATVEVTAGIQPGDKVILNPSNSLIEGERVRIGGGHLQ